jgi:Rod binding domain-containing protein
MPHDHDAKLRETARNLEAAFLTEMLKAAGLGEARDAFGGGEGEDQFASFLRTEHAKALVDRGGLGLSESIFNALKEYRDGPIRHA